MNHPSCDAEPIAPLGVLRVRYRVVGLTVLLAMVTLLRSFMHFGACPTNPCRSVDQ